MTVTRRAVVGVFFTALVCAWLAPARAAVPGPQTANLFLKLSGIGGGATAADHKGEIDVLSFNWSMKHEGPKAEPHDALILKSIDAATPKLLAACAAGTKIGQAVLTARGSATPSKDKESDFLVYTFTDVQITVVSHTVINGAQEQVQFRYGSVKVQYKEPDGTVVEETWDANAK